MILIFFQLIRHVEPPYPYLKVIYLVSNTIIFELARNLPIKLPDTSIVKDFLKLRRLDIIATELDDLPKKFRNSIDEFKKDKKVSKLIDKKATEEKFVNSANQFILKLTEYIEANELLGEENGKKGGIRSKFELIGFLRLYGEKAKDN